MKSMNPSRYKIPNDMKLTQDKEEFHKNDKVYFVANLIVALAVALMWYFLFYSDSFLVFLFFVTVG